MARRDGMTELEAKLRRWSCSAEWESTPKASGADASAVSGPVASSGSTFETVPAQSDADAVAGVSAPPEAEPGVEEFDFSRLLARARGSDGAPSDGAQQVRASMVARIRRRYFELVKLGVANNDAAAQAIVEVGGRVRPCRTEQESPERSESEAEAEQIEVH